MRSNEKNMQPLTGHSRPPVRTEGTGAKRKIPKWTGRILLGLVVAAIAVVLAAGLLPPRGLKTAGGRNRVLAMYAPMDDGIRLAVYIALPADLGKDGKVPAILETTRYGTMPGPTFLMRVLGNLGIAKLAIGGKPVAFPSRLDYLRHGAYGHGTGAAMDAFLDAGYAFVMASSRGSGASFGERPMEMSREEVADQGMLIRWIAAQDWSDGKIGTYGVSYSGNTAELACVDAPEALGAAAPFYSDYDPIGDNVLPGGILNFKLLKDWNDGNIADDANKNDNALMAAAAPVDGWTGGRLRKEAYTCHRTLDLYAALRNTIFLDEEFTPGYTAADIAPAAEWREAITASGVPFRVRAGWLDAATAGGAIERFLAFPNDQELDIGPWGHGGFTYCDPFLGVRSGHPETEIDQALELVAYFDRFLKEVAVPQGPQKVLRYYTYGTGRWTETETWPPQGVSLQKFRFGPGKTLVSGGDAFKDSSDGSATVDRGDTLDVDFSASSGETNRWRTNLGGGAVVYSDRKQEDGKLLFWDTLPLPEDQEITGSPWVSLWIESNAEDGAFHVYLEDVAPDGTVTYITEGLLRALHRKIMDQDSFSGALGPRHSFQSSDALPLVPGEAAELRIALEPISVLIKAGHRIRVAVAGADASNFVRIPTEGDVRFTVLRDSAHPSFVELPFMELTE